MINIEGIKRIVKKGKMKLMAMSLASTILLTGCVGAKDSIMLRGEELGYGLSKVDTTLYDENINLYTITKHDMQSHGEMYYINKYCTIKEFGNIVGEVNITWEDIKTTINTISIDDKYKTILLEGVNNLEKELPNVDLEVLNYNLKNLKIIDISNDDNFQNGYEIVGEFDSITHTVYMNYNDCSLKRTLYHEILGHGLIDGYSEMNGGIRAGLSSFYTSLSQNFNLDDLYQNQIQVGTIFDEAAAEMIDVIASGSKEETYYQVFLTELQLFLISTDTSLTELINKGTNNLLRKMKSNGYKNPVDLIINLEYRKRLLLDGEYFILDDYLITDLLSDYLIEILNNMKKKGKNNQELIEIGNSYIDSISQWFNPTIIDNEYGATWNNDIIGEFVSFNQMKNVIDNTYGEYKLKYYTSK